MEQGWVWGGGKNWEGSRRRKIKGKNNEWNNEKCERKGKKRKNTRGRRERSEGKGRGKEKRSSQIHCSSFNHGHFSVCPYIP